MVPATHRHKKRGTEYVLIGIGKMQAGDWLTTGIERFGGYDPGEPIDMREVAIYRSATDPSEIWVRPREEFEDGRFEVLEPTPEEDCEKQLEAALKFVQPKLIDLKTEKGLIGVWVHAWRMAWKAALKP